MMRTRQSEDTGTKTGYRMRTRFNKFINLPELIHLFKEVADIILPDMLDIKRPEYAGCGKRDSGLLSDSGS